MPRNAGGRFDLDQTSSFCLFWLGEFRVYVAWLHRHDKARWRFPRPKWPRNLIADRRQAFQIGGDRQGVGLCQVSEVLRRHHRYEDAPIRSFAFGDRSHDLLGRPVSEPCLLVGCQVRTNEHARAGNGEANVRSAEYLLVSGRPIRLPGVWQSVQPMISTTYLPRSTCASAACTVIGAAANPSAKIDLNPKRSTSFFTPLSCLTRIRSVAAMLLARGRCLGRGTRLCRARKCPRARRHRDRNSRMGCSLSDRSTRRR